METDWNQPITSPKFGLGEWPPAPALPKAERPLSSKAAPAIPAAIYETAETSTDLPLSTFDCRHARSSPPSFAFSCSFASPSRSGIVNAIDGTLFAYADGIGWEPLAAKVPWGTTYRDQYREAIDEHCALTWTKLINLRRTRVEIFLIHMLPVGSHCQGSGDILGFGACSSNIKRNDAFRTIVLDIEIIDFDSRVIQTA